MSLSDLTKYIHDTKVNDKFQPLKPLLLELLSLFNGSNQISSSYYVHMYHTLDDSVVKLRFTQLQQKIKTFKDTYETSTIKKELTTNRHNNNDSYNTYETSYSRAMSAKRTTNIDDCHKENKINELFSLLNECFFELWFLTEYIQSVDIYHVSVAKAL